MRPVRTSGFSLIELLVTIGVVALLISILVPALGKASDKSKELASAVNLRSIGQIFEMYIERSQDMYPAPVSGRMYPTPNPRIQMSMHHWQVSNRWHELFLDEYPWEANLELYLAPGAERDTSMRPVMTTIFPSFRYSASFLGAPSIWTDREIADGEWGRLEKSVRRPMVRYPSGKALMWDVEMPYIRRFLKRDEYNNLLEKTPILFADQHVTGHIPAEATPGVLNRAPFAAHLIENLHNTPEGVRGRDY